MSSFGFLTDAFGAESVKRARLLARSLRRHEPEVPIGLVAWCQAPGADRDFDVVVDAQDAEAFCGKYRTFNKLLTVGWHSPFDRGFFLDNDVVVVQPLVGVLDTHFRGLPYALNMARLLPDTPHHGLNHIDPQAVASEFGLSSVMDPCGGGHLYFELPQCQRFLREAIELALFERQRYEKLAGPEYCGGNMAISDEIAMAIVANGHDLQMPCISDLVLCLLKDTAEEVRISTDDWTLERFQGDGPSPKTHPRMVHFCADGKWSESYGLLAEKVLHEDYLSPRSNRLERFLKRIVNRIR